MTTTPRGADRQARRQPLLHLLSRMQHGSLLPAERDLLRTAVETELADGDQAHEGADHDRHRHALADALGWDRSIEWAKLLAEVKQRTRDAAAARQGEVEAIRARTAAEQRARALAADLSGTEAINERLRERAEIGARANQTAATEALERAEAAERRAQAAEAGMESTAADALIHSGCHRKLMAQCQRAERAEARERETRGLLHATEARLDTAEATIERMKRTNRMVNRGARDADERAERAEATLTAVRKAVADDFRHDHRALIEAALGDPQPATEPEADDTAPASPAYNLVSYIIERQWCDAARTTDQIHADIEPLLAAIRAESAADRHTYLSTGCLHGEHGYCQGKTGKAGAKRPAECKFCQAPCICVCHTEPAPELPTEPQQERRPNCRCATTTTFTLPETARPFEKFTLIGANVPVRVTPQQVADAVRRILREDRLRPGDVIR